jgi:hypothetical protein
MRSVDRRVELKTDEIMGVAIKVLKKKGDYPLTTSKP